MRWSSLTVRSSWLTLSICGGRAQWLGASSVAESLQGCRTGHPRMCIALRSGRLTCWVNRTGLFRRPRCLRMSARSSGTFSTRRWCRAFRERVACCDRGTGETAATSRSGHRHIRATSRIRRSPNASASQRVTACANSTPSRSQPRRLRALSAREAVSTMQSRCAGRLTIPNGICWWLRTRSAAGSVTGGPAVPTSRVRTKRFLTRSALTDTQSRITPVPGCSSPSRTVLSASGASSKHSISQNGV